MTEAMPGWWAWVGGWWRKRRTPAQRQGRRAEDLARRYLLALGGWQAVTRNWRFRRGEIDLVMREGPALVFVEVRSRQHDARVPGYASISHRKKRLLRQTARAYLRHLRERPATARFDVVEVVWEGQELRTIRHHRNVGLLG